MAKSRLLFRLRPMFRAPGERRFLLALAVSLLLHGALIGLSVPGAPVRHPPTVLHALLLPASESGGPLPALLHDTLSEEAPPAELPPVPLPAQAAIEPVRARDNELPPEARAATKTADKLLYPPEAVAAGIEGEVRVRITLDAAGTIAEASIARGSGHAVLDAAALRAAYAVGRLPGAPAGEALLPVIFRLR